MHAPCYAGVGNVRVKGFLSQGYINTSGNNYLGDSKSGSFDFGEVGLNLYYRPINRVYFSAQVSSRNVGDHDSGEDDFRLDYGLVGFNLFSSNSYDANFRVGRFKYFYGLYNDIQDISSAIPGVMPPQVMYYEYVLPDLTIDGIQLNQSFRFDDIGSINFDLLYGKSIADERENEENAFNNFMIMYYPYSSGATGEVSSYDGMGALRIQYLTPDNSLLVGYIHTLYDGNVTLDAVNSIYQFRGVDDGYADTLSLEYISDNWIFTSEYRTKFTKRQTKTTDLTLNLHSYTDNEFRTEAYYFQFRYQLSEKLETLLRYEAYFVNKCDRDGSKWAKIVQNQSINYYMYSKDWVVGAKYEINDDLILKSEFHVLDGAFLNYAAGSVGATDNNISEGLDRYWNMFLLELTYSF